MTMEEYMSQPGATIESYKLWKRYRERREAGLCVACPGADRRTMVEHKALCAKCAKIRSDREKAKRAEMRRMAEEDPEGEAAKELEARREFNKKRRAVMRAQKRQGSDREAAGKTQAEHVEP